MTTAYKITQVINNTYHSFINRPAFPLSIQYETGKSIISIYPMFFLDDLLVAQKIAKNFSQFMGLEFSIFLCDIEPLNKPDDLTLSICHIEYYYQACPDFVHNFWMEDSKPYLWRGVKKEPNNNLVPYLSDSGFFTTWNGEKIKLLENDRSTILSKFCTPLEIIGKSRVMTASTFF